MKTELTPLFCDVDLARRIEVAEAQLIEATALAAHGRLGDGRGFVIPIAGGLASFADDDSPFNKVVGLGFGGLPTTGELDEIEQAYATVGAPVQVELPHLADPEIGIVLSRRGYELESFENVLGVAIDTKYDVTLPDGIEIRPSGDEELDVWLNVMADAVAVPDTQGVPWREEFPRDTYIEAERDAASADITRYIALLNGEIAGGAGLRTTDGIAQFAGAGTLPAHRRHGIQSALLFTRLSDAAATGCDVGVITTQPASKSQQNAQRSGFSLLYTRAVLVKHLEAT
ncbi:GNAT family N-acetyltransferase [Kribbella sp. NBC_00709]|uniref:GNAT family N-acetyltransferase n=1 Tax=Kribbella sp. NBC_00709 TaxID=2975972 RepID=UPI002E2D22A9|nr:GNAT family N-acetyltransferase [Kribbella sp. NBC_00709]